MALQLPGQGGLPLVFDPRGHAGRRVAQNQVGRALQTLVDTLDDGVTDGDVPFIEPDLMAGSLQLMGQALGQGGIGFAVASGLNLDNSKIEVYYAVEFFAKIDHGGMEPRRS